MAHPVYRQSSAFRTVLYALAAALFLIFANQVQAQSPEDFTVEGVAVDATAKNAVLAREKALAEAQVAAYKTLAERLMSPEEFARFTPPDADTISLLIQDFEVTNEQLSTTRYKGTFTIRFRPNAIRTRMATQGVGPAQAQTQTQNTGKVLVLPMMSNAGGTSLWMESNPWMRAWRNMPTDRSVADPSVLPLGDAHDMTFVGDRDGLRYDPIRLQEMATRYGAQDIAVLMASTASTQDGRGQLVVDIYTNGFEGPRFVQKMTLDRLPNETEDALYYRAATRVKYALRDGAWKANTNYYPPVQTQQQPRQQQQPPHYQGQQPTQANPDVNPYTYYSNRTAAQPPATQSPPPIATTRPALGPVQNYKAVARFSSARDWVTIKNSLDRIYGMQAVMVTGLKPQEASIDMRYAGTPQALRLALQQANIAASQRTDGMLELMMGYTAPVYR